MTRSLSSHRSCSLRGAAVRFGAELVLSDVDLVVGPTDRLAVIGDNGAGKTTLLRMLAGATDLTVGERDVTLPGGIAYAEQRPCFPEGASVAEACDVVLWHVRTLERTIASVSAELASAVSSPALVTELADATDAFEACDGYLVDQRLDEGLQQLGLGSIDRDRPVDTLSGGERARLALAATLASSAEVLLLDEPTNDLDEVGLAWLDSRLSAHRGAIVVVTHDRVFLERFATDVIALEGGRLRRYGDGYSGYLAALAAERRAAAERFDRWLAERRRMRDLLDANTFRLNRIPRKAEKPGFGHGAFRSRSRDHGAVGRIRKARERLDRLDENPPPAPVEPLRFRGFDAADATCGPIIVTPGLTLADGSRVVVTGPNGAGKTTMLRMLAGEMSGPVERANGVRIGWLRQQSRLPFRPTCVEYFAAVTGRCLDDARARLEEMGLLVPDVLTKPVGDLSVGQQRRLELAVVVDAPNNVLLLDEPTNHLSPDLVDQLQSALEDFAGAVVTVTHDRRWIERADADVIDAGCESLWWLRLGDRLLGVCDERTDGSGRARRDVVTPTPGLDF
ncbi:MAG: ATP-binding cassette domain-containing protein [Gordonia sp. (in: high G+C Gram-positive bacteria)]|nr:ATP-binding cassette domain-containing protein [Gordonia sp. (in: high G+C Gram-positive bacteria)]